MLVWHVRVVSPGSARGRGGKARNRVEPPLNVGLSLPPPSTQPTHPTSTRHADARDAARWAALGAGSERERGGRERLAFVSPADGSAHTLPSPVVFPLSPKTRDRTPVTILHTHTHFMSSPPSTIHFDAKRIHRGRRRGGARALPPTRPRTRPRASGSRLCVQHKPGRSFHSSRVPYHGLGAGGSARARTCGGQRRRAVALCAPAPGRWRRCLRPHLTGQRGLRLATPHPARGGAGGGRDARAAGDNAR